MLELRGLAAGDYDLWLKRTGETHPHPRRRRAGASTGYVLGKLRQLRTARR